MDFCFFKNQIIPNNQANINIASHSLQYGSTCFAGIRGYVREGEVRIFRLKDHYERLMNASSMMRFGFYLPYDEFEKIIEDLIKKNRPQSDFYIRPFLFSENQVIGVSYINLSFHLAIYMVALSSFYPKETGLKLMVSNWKKISDAAMPTKAKAGGCYVNSSLATTDARMAGFDEALLMDQNENIVEASVANIFIVYRGEVFTPPIASDVLEGITWRTVGELLHEQQFKIRYEPISRSMVYNCEELFLTGTATQVVFAESVDGRLIGMGKEGKITTLVKGLFEDVINLKHPRSMSYIKILKKAEVHEKD
jgi:branched-chain amino acid aminotransferase